MEGVILRLLLKKCGVKMSKDNFKELHTVFLLSRSQFKFLEESEQLSRVNGILGKCRVLQCLQETSDNLS